MVRPRGLSLISSGVQATYQAFFGNIGKAAGRVIGGAGLSAAGYRLYTECGHCYG
jgi:hypothetical protein